MAKVAITTIGINGRLIQNALLTMAGLLFVSGMGWMVTTVISHESRLATIEASSQQVQDDVAYVRTRVDELVQHLLDGS